MGEKKKKKEKKKEFANTKKDLTPRALKHLGVKKQTNK